MSKRYGASISIAVQLVAATAVHFVFAIAVTVASVSAQESPRRALTVEDMFRFASVSSPVVRALVSPVRK